MSYITNSFDDQVGRLLKNGSVGLVPSDTIYGLSCRALDKTAVSRLHQIKQRDQRPFIILISDIKMLNLLSISQDAAALAEKYWPGALSLICPAPSSPAWLHMGAQTLAIRIPADEKLRDLIKAVGPLVSTSANPTGEPPATSVDEARQYFGDQLDFYVDVGLLRGQASTVAQVVNGKLEVIRQGAVRINDI